LFQFFLIFFIPKFPLESLVSPRTVHQHKTIKCKKPASAYQATRKEKFIGWRFNPFLVLSRSQENPTNAVLLRRSKQLLGWGGSINICGSGGENFNPMPSNRGYEVA